MTQAQIIVAVMKPRLGTDVELSMLTARAFAAIAAQRRA
jgi:hypothetical protein